MKFIETVKNRAIEKNTMDLAMSWYHRYLEKEEELEKIDRALAEFENGLISIVDNNDMIKFGDLQKIWNKTINL